jgi:2,3-bisphosphoglycerate-dependent phosphoglycerate mutase
VGLLLLIRHGRTPANVEGILAGRTPGVELDEVGRKTAYELGDRLGAVPVVHVVSSPLERTQQTASLALSSVPLDLDERLIECDYGLWQGRKISELATEDMWKVVQEKPADVTFPSGEAMSAMAARAVESVREWDAKLSAEHGNDVVWAAVSHGDVIKAICADALGMSLNDFQRIMIDPCSVSVIRYSETGSAISKLNDTGSGWLEKLKAEDPQLGGQSGKGQE